MNKFQLHLRYLVLLLLTSLLPSQAILKDASRLEDFERITYKALFPKRRSSEAAVVEWGHSAIISALDVVVAKFGPQTSMGASFEVETSPILADPIDGYTNLMSDDTENIVDDHEETQDEKGPRRILNNAASIHGNMCVMTNSAGMTGVQMAKIAKDSGAAALMVVNVLDPENPDSVYPLECESQSECEYADKYIDIPVIMASLSSGNVLTTARNVEESSRRRTDPQAGLPERVRLYAGGDRPFFEDVKHEDPVVYLIHNLLTAEECDMIIDRSRGKMLPFDDTINDFLEGTATAASMKASGKMVHNVERTFLWRGLFKSAPFKLIDERIEQVTGFPQAHFSDFQVNKLTAGSYHRPHYDSIPTLGQLATIHIFLTDGNGTSGGEFVFPYASRRPIKITPKQGMAVVYHNLEENGDTDQFSAHGELPVIGEGIEVWTARKWIYVEPLPKSHRIALPVFALFNGGRLPHVIKATIYGKMLEQFGVENGNRCFDELVVFIPVIFVIILMYFFGYFVSGFTRDKTQKNKSKISTKSKEKLK